jgi:hypothetical protein
VPRGVCPKDICMNSFTAFRAQIYHEDELINHRVSWFAAAQAFFFLVFIQCEGPARADYSKDVAAALKDVAGLTILLAPLICVFALTSIMAAILKTWKCIREYEAVGGESEEVTPTLHAFDLTHFSGLVAPILIPLAILGAWLYLSAVLGRWLAFGVNAAAFILFICAVLVQLRTILTEKWAHPKKATVSRAAPASIAD